MTEILDDGFPAPRTAPEAISDCQSLAIETAGRDARTVSLRQLYGIVNQCGNCPGSTNETRPRQECPVTGAFLALIARAEAAQGKLCEASDWARSGARAPYSSVFYEN